MVTRSEQILTFEKVHDSLHQKGDTPCDLIKSQNIVLPNIKALKMILQSTPSIRYKKK